MGRTLLAAAVLLCCACPKPPPDRACVKMQTLCGTTLEDCGSRRDSVKEKFGQEALDALDACYLSATTCSEANGCVAGAALKATGEAAKEFFQGLQKELERK